MRRKRTVAVLMTAAFAAEMILCAGCGKKGASSAPKLIEPAAANSSCRAVEIDEVGKTEVLLATVVAKDYCSFYSTNVEVSEIVVEVGDRVQAGDVVAYADVDAAKETLGDLTAELANENRNYELSSRITRMRIVQAETAVDIEEGERAARLAAEWENLRYDGLLHEYRVEKLNESIEKQREVIATGTLSANHAGTVTYTKDLGKSTNAGAYENIVIVSDPQETYLELTDSTIDKYQYSKYEVKYMMIAGKRHEVAEIAYSMDEIILAKASNAYPNVRLTCSEVGNLALGDTYPVYFRKKEGEKMPVIGLDSLYGEEGAYYVYVVHEDGEQEKREVTIGEKDDNYAQVTDGLEEGELVYYASEARMPENYEEYTVKLSDYNVKNMSKHYELSNRKTIWYDAPYEGTVTEVMVRKDDTVEAGDLLYVIDSGAGRAALKEARNKIHHENVEFEKTIKGVDEQLAAEEDENARAILSLQRELVSVNHAYRLSQLQKDYNRIAKNNDGTGKVSVYARAAGTIAKAAVSNGEFVKMGSHIVAVGENAKNKLLVQMVKEEKEETYPDNIADFGEKITLTVEDREYIGYCTGWTVNEKNKNKVWVSSNEEGANLSRYPESDAGAMQFYVEMEDESFYEDVLKGKMSFSYLTMQQIVAVPTSLVHEEKKFSKPGESFYYVWRVADGGLVKQYVIVDTSLSDINTTVILSGVEEKDVLAKPKK